MTTQTLYRRTQLRGLQNGAGLILLRFRFLAYVIIGV